MTTTQSVCIPASEAMSLFATGTPVTLSLASHPAVAIWATIDGSVRVQTARQEHISTFRPEQNIYVTLG